MKKFIRTLFAFLSIPVFTSLLIIFFYIKRDVHYDFGNYKNYSWKYGFQTLGDISTKKLLNSKTDYNSFIFGSSRVVGLYACYLQNKIAGAEFFHYANWTETIGGIYAKLRLLDSLGYSLNNIFIYIDTDYTFASDGGCLYNDHYLLTNENKYKSMLNHFQEFFFSMDMDKLKILTGYKLKGKVFPDWNSDTLTNDSKHVCSVNILESYGAKKQIIQNFYVGDTISKILEEVKISAEEENIMTNIKEILERHNSKYYIIITPLADQLKFNPSDMHIIDKIFGKNVYDFSGINKYTINEDNYSDKVHFLDYISKEIADSVIIAAED